MKQLIKEAIHMFFLVDYWWLWLPDKCQMTDCCRRGVRGNENIVDGKIVCDYCSAKRLSK